MNHVQLLAYDLQRAPIINPLGTETEIDLTYNDPNGPSGDALEETNQRFGILAHPARVGQELFIRALPPAQLVPMASNRAIVLGAISSDRLDYDNQGTPGYQPRFVWPTAPVGAFTGPLPGGQFLSLGDPFPTVGDPPVASWEPKVAILRWTGSYWLVVTATMGASLRETQLP